MTDHVILLILFLFVTSSGLSSQVKEEYYLRCLFYNTENLFDIEDDPLTEDDEFLPDGVRRWNYTRFTRKINSLYKVLAAAGSMDQPPAIAGFCEIENRKVLENLIYGTYLSKFNYGIVHGDSKDPRGIDVGLIYRKDILSLICSKLLIPDKYEPSEFRTRDVLYSKFLVAGDTLHIFLNHWPSRRGGVLAGEDERLLLSGMILHKSDSIYRALSGKAKIIIAGDFNCNPEDNEISLLTDRSTTGSDGVRLINLNGRLMDRGEGTYKYQGTWEMFDQVIISGWLINAEYGLYTDDSMFRIFKPDFMMEKDPSYPGYIPFSTYRGYRYQGGFSDHLPVILDLKIRQPDH